MTASRAVRTDLTAHYPVLRGLGKAVKSGNWKSVSEFFAGLPARSDQSVPVTFVGRIAGSEQFLQRMVDAERESALARTLLGARFIRLAWDARSGLYAQYVSSAQRQLFHDHLQRAERVLGDATAMDPTRSAPWTLRLATARGLSLDLDEARRRYQRAAEHCDCPYFAQSQLLQQLCPKWGGSEAQMHEFANDCLSAATPGSLGGAIVADAHVEHALTFNYLRQIHGYLAQRQVRDELRAAAAATVLHPRFKPEFGWVQAHSVFAWAFHRGGDEESAARHFDTLGNRMSTYPWEVLAGGKTTAAIREARRAVRKR